MRCECGCGYEGVDDVTQFCLEEALETLLQEAEERRKRDADVRAAMLDMGGGGVPGLGAGGLGHDFPPGDLAASAQAAAETSSANLAGPAQSHEEALEQARTFARGTRSQQ